MVRHCVELFGTDLMEHHQKYSPVENMKKVDASSCYPGAQARVLLSFSSLFGVRSRQVSPDQSRRRPWPQACPYWRAHNVRDDGSQLDVGAFENFFERGYVREIVLESDFDGNGPVLSIRVDCEIKAHSQAIVNSIFYISVKGMSKQNVLRWVYVSISILR